MGQPAIARLGPAAVAAAPRQALACSLRNACWGSVPTLDATLRLPAIPQAAPAYTRARLVMAGSSLR